MAILTAPLDFDVTPYETFPILRTGLLEARLAKTKDEVEAAQKLRFQVFYEECGAQANAQTASEKRDFDGFDAFCHHLLVIDKEADKIVGTYRFMLRSAAKQCGGYYTSSEFDIDKLVSCPGEIMELGRSCVHKDYRTRPTIQLLWRWLASYIDMYGVQVCFGCASFPGVDINQYDQALSYLYYNHLAPENLRSKALPHLYQPMNILPKEKVDYKQAMKQLPPLIKGYLRLGGFVGEGAIIDHQFNTVDVCIIVKRKLAAERYSQRYGRPNASQKADHK